MRKFYGIITSGLIILGMHSVFATDDNTQVAKQKPTAEETYIKDAKTASKKQLGVNTFLWYSAKRVLKFLPMQTVNPYIGELISDWYISPNAPNERIKVQVSVLSKTLRTDGITVQVFRAKRNKGVWVNQAVNPSTATYLKDAILRQARKLRIASGASALS